MSNKPEDIWTYQKVLTPFPGNAIRVTGQLNMYVALWYRHGKPLMGKAWNDMGVVQCEFAFDKKVVNGPEVGGAIQLLTYEGNHNTRHFFYEWFSVAAWKNEEGIGARQMVHCGQSAPLYWEEMQSLGNFDLEKQIGTFCIQGKCVEVKDGRHLDNMKVLTRNTQGGPPNCRCDTCISNRTSQAQPQVENDWIDCCCGNPWPEYQMVRALDRKLNTSKGPQDHFVALWYRHGKPLMGRAWKCEKGIINASFSDGGQEFTGSGIGSIQMLNQMPSTTTGFEYVWLPFEQANRLDEKKVFPVHLNFVAPCVIAYGGGHEVLGHVNMKDTKAEAVFYGTRLSIDRPELSNVLVLCRKEGNDTLAI